ncbi:MAG: lamin tail domain-containing protein [Saprospiraceae bacterium]|nr:lamin tail domain-containing protein [Saprospiraceae bacterium]
MKKHLLLFFLCISASLLLATTHEVTVQNNFFSPRDLVIEAGDTVVWTSIEGFHNVNGSQEDYPSNPESFINGSAAPSPWDFTFVFDKPGFYNYHCDPHRAIDMLGTITVTPKLVITEIMYNPPESGLDSLEYIEIFNNGPTDVNLKDYSLDGVTYTFPGFNLDAGSYVMVAVDSVAFQNNFGQAAFQWVSGSLSNGGETLMLLDAAGMVVDSVDYDDGNGWPSSADGLGASLVLCDADTDNNDPANWQAASTLTGVNLNGFDVFANPGATSQCLIGPLFYILTDDFEIEENVGTVTFQVVLENAGGTGTFSVFSRVLGASTATEDMDFTYPDDTMIEFTDVESDTAEVTVTIVDDEEIEAIESIEIDLNFPSEGAAINPLRKNLTISIRDNDAQIPAIVINELMYNNPGTDSLEYLELFNNDNAAVDLAGYSFSAGIEFTFPSVTLQPGDYLIIATDSVAFERNFEVAAFQWTGGSLNNGGELVQLRDAFGNIVDEVDYDDGGDWPSEADGGGGSLILCDVNADNNMASNWKAATKATGVFAGDGQLLGSPGAANDCADPGDPNFPAYDIGVVTTNNAEGRPDSLGVTCQLQGIVYGVDLRGGGGLQFTIIDSNNDGIGLFSFTEEFGYTVAEGDEVIVKGEITQFRGLTQIEPADLVLVSSGNDLVAPAVVTELGEDTESQLVKLEGVSLVSFTSDSGGGNAEITDGTNTYTMRLDSDTGLAEGDIPSEPFNVIGIGGQFDPDGNAPFDAGYQIQPRYIADFEVISSTFDPTLAATIEVFPNPTSDQVQVKMETTVDLIRLTDALGREVLRLRTPSLNTTIELAGLARGIYQLQFIAEGKFWTTQLIKQ